jgi:hypothetical protein
MNVADIKRRVTNVLGDDAKIIFEDADLLDMINDAQIDICRKTGLTTSEQLYSLSTTTSSWALPPDCIEVLRVVSNGTKLYKTTWQEVDMLDPTKDSGSTRGNPTCFFVMGNKITFYPYTSTNTTNSIRVVYSCTPTILVSDSDVPDIPIAYHEDIVIRVIAKGHELVEDFQAAGVKAAEYDKAITLTQEQAQEVSDESYPYIRDIEGSYY